MTQALSLLCVQFLSLHAHLEDHSETSTCPEYSSTYSNGAPRFNGSVAQATLGASFFPDTIQDAGHHF